MCFYFSILSSQVEENTQPEEVSPQALLDTAIASPTGRRVRSFVLYAISFLLSIIYRKTFLKFLQAALRSHPSANDGEIAVPGADLV